MKHTAEAFCRLLYKNSGKIRLRDVYRMRLGKRQGQTVWIVNGDRIFNSIYSAFVMGGNDQRYRFNPPDEVWIDDRIGIEELRYTLEHELLERKLMRQRGWSYVRAHNEALALEKKLRQRDRLKAKRRNAKQFPGWTEGVYRAPLRTVNGVKVWIVDGPLVRERLNGDFCFGGHSGKYSFIPEGEIWLDSAMPVVRGLLSIVQETAERQAMSRGKSYLDAYPVGLLANYHELLEQSGRAMRHESRLAAVRYGTRERGARTA